MAVIYGSLPPNTKLAQAAKFNDPNNSCKIMVATDAIGMGLNLYVAIFFVMFSNFQTDFICNKLSFHIVGAYDESYFIRW